MESIEVVIHTNGFFTEGRYCPVEVAAVDVTGDETPLLISVYWDYDSIFTWKDCELNEKLRKEIHGIPYKEINERHPSSINLRRLKDFFKSLRYYRVGCWGSLQKKVLKTYLQLEDVKNLKSLMNEEEPETPLVIQHRNIHPEEEHMKNCALNIANTYAKAIKRWRRENFKDPPMMDEPNWDNDFEKLTARNKNLMENIDFE